METSAEKIARVIKEHVDVVPYDCGWQDMFEHWDRLLFRDYLIDHPDVAAQYGKLKERLSRMHAQDRVTYTKAKTDFITAVTQKARLHYNKEAHIGIQSKRLE